MTKQDTSSKDTNSLILLSAIISPIEDTLVLRIIDWRF